MIKQSNIIREKIFEGLGNSISAWLMSTKSLLAASRLIDNNAKKVKKVKNVNPFELGNKLFPISNLALSSSFMLKGYAIECFFKAIWLSMGKKFVENGKYKGIPQVGGHDLTQLSKKLGLIIFNKSEEKYLNTLTKYSIAYGRYPISKLPERRHGRDIPDNDFEVFEDIIKKIANEISQYPAFNKKIDAIHLKHIIELVSK